MKATMKIRGTTVRTGVIVVDEVQGCAVGKCRKQAKREIWKISLALKPNHINQYSMYLTHQCYHVNARHRIDNRTTAELNVYIPHFDDDVLISFMSCHLLFFFFCYTFFCSDLAQLTHGNFTGLGCSLRDGGRSDCWYRFSKYCPLGITIFFFGKIYGD